MRKISKTKANCFLNGLLDKSRFAKGDGWADGGAT